jgi:predicted nucleic acid-binding protein
VNSIVLDTGVWIALFDPRERAKFKSSSVIESRIEAMTVVLPWPIVYETLRTKFVRNVPALVNFEKYLKSPSINFIDDLKYRDKALELVFESSLRNRRPLSFVDCMIRILLDAHAPKIKYLATFNSSDFADVCRKHRIEILDENAS